jgi:hypothetical protein
MCCEGQLYLGSYFLWYSDMKKKINQLHKWSIICHRKRQGGFAGRDVEVTTIALLTK